MPAAAPLLLFTVPDNETWLVKRFSIQNSAVVQARPALSLRVAGVNGALWLDSVAGQSALDQETWWALDAGAELRIDPVGATSLTVALFGAKLQGLAP